MSELNKITSNSFANLQATRFGMNNRQTLNMPNPVQHLLASGDNFYMPTPKQQSKFEFNKILADDNKSNKESIGIKPNQIQKQDSFLPPIATAQKPVEKVKVDFFMERLNQLCNNRVAEIVYLNIYNVTNINGCLEWFGFGLYHTSVGMYDLEFSYGGHENSNSGIVVVDKGNSAGLVLKESIPVGITYYSADEIDEIVD